MRDGLRGPLGCLGFPVALLIGCGLAYLVGLMVYMICGVWWLAAVLSLAALVPAVIGCVDVLAGIINNICGRP